LITADAAFANAANAAAAAFKATPPYIAYRVTIHTIEAGAPRDEEDSVVLRTRDGAAVVDGGASLQTDPPGLPPSVDALANWSFTPSTRNGRLVMHVNYLEPLRYQFATPAPNVDVVVRAIKGFAVSYDGDDTTHVRLEPASAEVKALAKQHNRFLYRDVWFDPATWLPTRVVVTAPNATLTLEYTTVAGHWLLAHVIYDSVEQSQRSSSRSIVDLKYGQFEFPAALTDAKSRSNARASMQGD